LIDAVDGWMPWMDAVDGWMDFVLLCFGIVRYRNPVLSDDYITRTVSMMRQMNELN